MNVIFIYMTFLLYIAGVFAMSMEKRLSELERVIRLQSTTLKNHDKIIQDQNFIIENFENENYKLKLRVESLENEMAERGPESTTVFDKSFQSVHITTLDSDQLDNSSGTIADYKDNVENNVVSDLDSNAKHTQIVKRQSTDDRNVAFHAYVSGKPCFQNHQILVFDVKILDVGNGYSTRDGIYVVPDTGYYVFTWTVGSYNDHWYRTNIVINGIVSGWITVQDVTAATGILVAHVSAGDLVFIRRNNGTNCGVHDEYTRSTFSGWKLF